MDSKLRKMAILASMGVILLVSLLVLYTNGSGNGRADGPKGTAPPRQESGQGASEGQAQIGSDGVVNGQIGNDLSAFLRDDTFFDQEVNPILEEAMDNASRLSLVVTSVEKDLRVQIVDMEGKPVTGESFFVRLDGLGEYKDLDKDGIIYIGDLAAGEYSVELMPMEGYRVPANETRVKVKDKVEYVAIDDISLLLLTEDDIDAAAEDTAVADALTDADSTEIQKLQRPTANSKVGIDVSKWNGDIDWDMVKNAGVEFAIIRAGYRGSVTGSLVEDPRFADNIRGATASGIPVGVYFFTQGIQSGISRVHRHRGRRRERQGGRPGSGHQDAGVRGVLPHHRQRRVPGGHLRQPQLVQQQSACPEPGALLHLAGGIPQRPSLPGVLPDVAVYLPGLRRGHRGECGHEHQLSAVTGSARAKEGR